MYTRILALTTSQFTSQADCTRLDDNNAGDRRSNCQRLIVPAFVSIYAVNSTALLVSWIITFVPLGRYTDLTAVSVCMCEEKKKRIMRGFS